MDGDDQGYAVENDEIASMYFVPQSWSALLLDISLRGPEPPTPLARLDFPGTLDS